MSIGEIIPPMIEPCEKCLGCLPYKDIPKEAEILI